MSKVSDQYKRDLALDPCQSFIVQAPAGSGKTELLIQRFLMLLARVNMPEEVVAITFTRKAAMEMRERILHALSWAAASAPLPNSDHAQKTWHLANEVLKRNHHFHWNLLENPGRLKLQTIDSLAYEIVRRSPTLSEMGGIAQITEDPDRLYSLAIKSLFNHADECLESDKRAFYRFLLHLNNDGLKIERLLKVMLATRDQWLDHVFYPKDRERLEESLKNLNQYALEQCIHHFPAVLEQELIALLRYSFNNKGTTLEKLPGSGAEDKNVWKEIAHLLLKKDFNFRETVTAAHGFPSESSTQNADEKSLFKSMKLRFKNLIEKLKSFEEFRQSLQLVLELPSLSYSEAQWEILSSFIEILKRLIVELKLIFLEKKQVDFAEVTQSAKAALGMEGQPSELALMLDYKISHLLIDEFQDTSIAQFKLITRLVSGWHEGDGRTLFLVGDPMQSIYRFRQAEVGLFLIAQKKGIANIPLTSIQLEVNFRSEKGLLDWINHKFADLFSDKEDIQLGTVSFAPSVPFRDSSVSAGVFTHYVNPEEEAQAIISIVRKEREVFPEHRIAVLVRSRSHLQDIIPALLEANLPFQAVEIASLKEKPIIYDLLAITRVLLNPVDKLAWLSIFRAPWCGLSLHDMHSLVFKEPKSNFLNILKNIPESLSEEGRKRVVGVGKVFESAIKNRARQAVWQWVELTWIKLKGPACYDAHSFQEAQSYFKLLEQVEKEMGFVDLDHLENRLDRLFANHHPESSRETLQLMTIHKAKGLEFDCVIIPGLARKPKNNTSPILRWLEQAYLEGKTDLILAPIKAVGENEDSIYRYLGLVEKNKQEQELVRLLYVAATRGKSSLHWMIAQETHLRSEKPPSNSFLSLLKLTPKESTQMSVPPEKKPTEFKKFPLLIKRLKLPYFDEENIFQEQLIQKPIEPFVSHFNHNHLNQKVGTVIHHLFDQIIQQGLAETLIENERLWEKWLMNEGCLPEYLPKALDMIRLAVKNTLNDPVGRWILDNSHQESQSEYALATISGSESIHLRLDRAFIDEKGNRWIIDYKVIAPEPNQPIELFLQEMRRRYIPQLQTYKRALKAFHKAPVFFGLYFPLIPAWDYWESTEESLYPDSAIEQVA